MREGWSPVELGDIADVETGTTPSKKVAENWGGDFPFVKPPQIQDGGIQTAVDWLTDKGAEKARIASPHSTLITTIGVLGRAGYVRREVAFNQQISCVRFDPSIVVPRFGFAVLAGMTPWLNSVAGTSVVPQVNKSTLLKAPIQLPPLAEQARIADLLDSSERVRFLLGEASQAARGALVALASHLLAPKESWRQSSLGEVTACIRNGVSAKQTAEPSDFPVTRIETISADRVDASRVGYLEQLSPEKVERFRLKKGDLLFSHINSLPQIGRAVAYRGTPEFLLHGMNLLMLRPEPSLVRPRFLEFLLHDLRRRGVFERIATKAVNQVSINQKNLSAVKVAIPSLAEQDEIVSVLSAADELAQRSEGAHRQQSQLQRSVAVVLLSGDHEIPESYDRFLEGRECDDFPPAAVEEAVAS